MINASNDAAEQVNKAAKTAVRHGKGDFIEKRAAQIAPPVEGEQIAPPVEGDS